MSSPIKLVFFGTPDFAVPTLMKLHDSGFEIAAVVTQPDRPRSRGLETTPSSVKTAAQKIGVNEILQPEKARDPEFIAQIAGIRPDIAAVVAYGQILKPALLQIPRLGCVNLHGSILPKYRGAAPIHRAVMAGETVTGVTTMLMDEGMDTGAMLLKAETPVSPEDTAGTVHDRLAAIGADLMAQTLRGLINGTIRPEKQDDSMATYAPKIDKSELEINWARPAREIDLKIRGLSPFPGAFTHLGKNDPSTRIKLVQSGLGPVPPSAESMGPGRVAMIGQDGITVTTASGGVVIKRLKAAGGKELAAYDYSLGHRLKTGDFFTSI